MINTESLLNAIDVDVLLAELRVSYDRTENCARIRCPLGTHEDTDPSFLFYFDSRRWECRSCGEKGDAIQFTAALLNKQRPEAALWLAKRFNVRAQIVVNPLQIESWHETLLVNSRYLQVLHERKGLTLETIREARIGLDSDRITIPIKDREGSYVDVRFYNPFSDGKNKYTHLRDAASKSELYPYASLSRDPIFLTEGEFKALALVQRGFAGLTTTGGVAAWRADWSELLRGKTVILVHDIDAPGRKAANKRAKVLYQFAKTVLILTLPLSSADYPTGGIDDYFTRFGATPEDFSRLCDSAKPWQPQQIREQELDNNIYDAALSKASAAEFFAKRVAVSAVVSAKDTAPYLIPSTINVACDRDQEICVACPIMNSLLDGEKGTHNVEINIESAQLLELLDVPSNRLQAAFRRVCGIPERCAVSTCRAAETINIEELRLVPQLDVARSDEENVVARAFYVGHGIETNTAYSFEARVYPDPKTQHAVLLAYKAAPNQDCLSTFTLSQDSEAALRIFQPAEWTPEAIETRLGQIYADLSANVTRIYQRQDVHLFVDLLYHTVRWFRFQGVQVKGWGEGLIIGDTGQGKSEVCSRLREHYGLGEKVETKSATVAGLLGGVQESGKRWLVTWGTIPLNNGRLVILEEVKGMPEETISKLTDMRSSGVAEIIKIERRKTNAQTRLIWISNPRSQRQLNTYNHGVEAVKELLGSLEDVRRFDMAMAVATGQVPYALLNLREADRPSVPHIFAADTCRNLILWAWSRSVDQVQFTDDAITACLSHAAAMGKDYSSSIPLVEPADQRLKIARLATALAARTFSHSQDATSIIVRGCHVEVVVRFLRRIYDDPVMGYRAYSEVIRDEESVRDPAEVKQAVLNTRYPRDFVRSVLSARVLNDSDVQNFSGLDRDAARDLLSTLVRKNCVLSGKRSYVKTPAFTALLRDLQTNGALDSQDKLIEALAGKSPMQGKEF